MCVSLEDTHQKLLSSRCLGPLEPHEQRVERATEGIVAQRVRGRVARPRVRDACGSARKLVEGRRRSGQANRRLPVGAVRRLEHHGLELRPRGAARTHGEGALEADLPRDRAGVAQAPGRVRRRGDEHGTAHALALQPAQRDGALLLRVERRRVGHDRASQQAFEVLEVDVLEAVELAQLRQPREEQVHKCVGLEAAAGVSRSASAADEGHELVASLPCEERRVRQPAKPLARLVAPYDLLPVKRRAVVAVHNNTERACRRYWAAE